MKDEVAENGEMKPRRMAPYILIALIAVVIAYHVLVQEPPPGWPINLIHLLFRL